MIAAAAMLYVAEVSLLGAWRWAALAASLALLLLLSRNDEGRRVSSGQFSAA